MEIHFAQVKYFGNVKFQSKRRYQFVLLSVQPFDFRRFCECGKKKTSSANGLIRFEMTFWNKIVNA